MENLFTLSDNWLKLMWQVSIFKIDIYHNDPKFADR